jgi:hypothetical protein
MIGSGSAPSMLAARALLAGNGVAHRWIDTDTDPVGRLLAENAQLGVERRKGRLDAPDRRGARGDAPSA